MKTRLFDGKLYREGLRQLRSVGLSTTLLLTLLSLIQPIAALCGGVELHYQDNSMYDRLISVMIGRFWDNTVRSLEQATLFPFLAAIVLTPIFVFRVFRFLNRRSASDFYHSLAHSRLTLYISFYAAALTWVAAAMLLPTVTAVGILALASDLTILWGAIWKDFLCMLMLALLTGGAAALARSLTGTRFSAAMLLVVILFLPRLLIDTWLGLLYAQLPMIQGCAVVEWSVFRLNFFTNALLADFFYETVASSAAGSSASVLAQVLYTMALGLIYAVLGGWAFYARHSETAGCVTPNRALKAVYRVGLCMLVCVPACVRLLSDVEEPEDWVAVIVLYALALAVFVLYELLTTRRWKSVLYALPTLAVLVVLNAAFIGGFQLCRHQVLRVTPATEEITAVRVVDIDKLGLVKYYNYPEDAQDDYITLKSREIDLTEEEAREVVSEALGGLVARTKAGDLVQRETPVRVEMDVNGKMITRAVQLDPRGIVALRNCYQADDEYRCLVAELPSLSEQGVTLLKMGELTDKSAQRTVYDTLREELTTVDVDRWMAHVADAPYIGYSSATGGFIRPEFEVRIEEDGETYIFRSYVPKFLTKTCSAYLAATQGDARSKVLERLQSSDLSELSEIDLHLYNFPGHPEEAQWFTLQVTDAERLRQVAATLSSTSPDVSQPTVTISLDKYQQITFAVDAEKFLAIEGLPDMVWNDDLP